MTAPSDTRKRREIVFHPLPPGQVEHALAALEDWPALAVTLIDAQTLCVEYHIVDYTLRDLEELLHARGFHLENTLLIRIRRSLAYYSERVQRENLDKPEPRTKNYPAHIESWTKRPHGDHDETPAEWRQYK